MPALAESLHSAGREPGGDVRPALHVAGRDAAPVHPREDERAWNAERDGAPVARLRRLAGRDGGAEGLPVLPAFSGLLPDGLPRGHAVTVDGAGALPLALIAGAVPSRRPAVPGPERWGAVVGLPGAGMLAATEMGADPARLVLVDEPGERWAQIVATLAAAVDVIVFRPPSPPRAGEVRKLGALARRHGTAFVVAGGWDGAAVRLSVTASRWSGLGEGHGHLRARQVRIVADGRGAGRRPRSAELWLPGPDGTASLAGPARSEGGGEGLAVVA